MTAPTAIQLSPRPGSVTHVNYPLRPTGDVMVKLELVRDDGKHVGLSAVRVQLVPAKGAPVEVTTEFDGSALFSGLPVGFYTLQLDPTRAQDVDWALNWSRIHLARTAKAGELTVTVETGMPNLARIELKVMFTELLARLPDIELATAEPLPFRASNFIVGPEAMPVRFTPA